MLPHARPGKTQPQLDPGLRKGDKAPPAFLSLFLGWSLFRQIFWQPRHISCAKAGAICPRWP